MAYKTIMKVNSIEVNPDTGIASLRWAKYEQNLDTGELTWTGKYHRTTVEKEVPVAVQVAEVDKHFESMGLPPTPPEHVHLASILRELAQTPVDDLASAMGKAGEEAVEQAKLLAADNVALRADLQAAERVTAEG